MDQFRPVDILMIDDDELDVELFQRTLAKKRIANRLVWAQDGVEALSILRGQSETKVVMPVIVLLDINMPRMNGHEFLDEVRADSALKHLTIFVMSTSRDDQDVFKAYEQNVAGYMVKSALGDSFVEGIEMLDHYWRVIELPTEKPDR
jgi:CheY-like chemotaxis protein